MTLELTNQQPEEQEDEMQDEQTVEQGNELSGEEADVATDKPAETVTGMLKIVISLKGNKASVGVQAPECDPAFFGLEGDLSAALTAVPGFVEQARTRWQTAKRYPKCASPLPSQSQPAPRLAGQRPTTQPAKPKEQLQPSMQL